MGVYFDTLDAQETLTRMQIQIRDVGHEILPQQLEAWQTEDMHRHFPNVEQPNYVSAATTIWPRSRTFEQTHKGRAFKQKRPMSARPRLVGTYGGQRFTSGMSHRPILRPALFDMLVERMTAMIAVNLKWVTSRTEGAQAPTSGPDPNVQKRLAMLQPSNL